MTGQKRSSLGLFAHTWPDSKRLDGKIKLKETINQLYSAERRELRRDHNSVTAVTFHLGEIKERNSGMIREGGNEGEKKKQQQPRVAGVNGV